MAALPWPQKKPHSLMQQWLCLAADGFLEAVAVASPILLQDMIGSQSEALQAAAREESRGSSNAYHQRGIAASLALASCFHH